MEEIIKELEVIINKDLYQEKVLNKWKTVEKKRLVSVEEIKIQKKNVKNSDENVLFIRLIMPLTILDIICALFMLINGGGCEIGSSEMWSGVLCSFAVMSNLVVIFLTPILILYFIVKGVKILEELTKHLDKYNGEFIIKSFNPFYIWWFKVNRPNIVRGLLVSKLKKKKMNRFFKYTLSKMWFNCFAKPDFIAFDYRDLPNKKIEKLQKKGFPILLFTLSSDDIVKYDNDYNGFLYEEKRK